MSHLQEEGRRCSKAAVLSIITHDRPCDAPYDDFHLRRQNGQEVDADDYYRRFPERARELAKLLGGTADKHTTSILAARVPVTFRAGEHVDDFDLLALLGEGRFAQVF